MARPLWKRSGYFLIKNMFLIMCLIYFRFRWRGVKYFPKEGGALICCNHQSYLDPVLVGTCFWRQLNFLARKTLFESFPFGAMIHYLDAIPIDRDGMGLAGFKESLRRLKRGEMLVIFPEGTRTLDGKVAPLMPGFVALARRGRVPILPCAVDGAFEAWPRSKRVPRPRKIRTIFGPQIPIEQIKELSDEELVQEVHRRIVQCSDEGRQLRGIRDE